jgi:hypothetical protein
MVYPGDTARRVAHCNKCGYGISVVFEPDFCPMCQGSASWVDDSAEWLGGAAWNDVNADVVARTPLAVAVSPLEAAYVARQTAIRNRASMLDAA